MKRIVKLELKRAKKIYDPKLIVSLAIILIVLLGFFFIVLKTGGRFHNKYYRFHSEDKLLHDVLVQCDKFISNEYYDLYVLSGLKIHLIPYGYRGVPASQSAYVFLKKYNYYIISEENISPSLYLNIIEHEQKGSEERRAPEDGYNASYVGNNTKDHAKDVTITNDSLENNHPPVIEIYSVDNINNRNQSNAMLYDNNLSAKDNRDDDIYANNATDVSTIITKKEDIDKQGIVANTTRYITPRDLEPRMPFDQIYLAMSFIIFLTFISLMYTNRVMDEKVNKKSMLLFIAPIEKYKVVIGKMILYLLSSFVISLVLWAIHTTHNIIQYSLLALSIIFSYFAISFFIGIVSRSFKELSFLGIFGISLYSLFLLIPVFLMNFSAASYASPLTPLIMIITGKTISSSSLLFSIIPHMIFALVLFMIGYHLFNPEDMFSYKRLYEKVLDFYRLFLKNKISYLLSGFFALYFIYLIELLLVVTFVTMNKRILLVSILLASALVEEAIRNLPMYASKFTKTKDIVIYSALVGFGFFLAEKTLLLISIAPFTRTLTIIQFSTLLFPLFMHIALTFLFSLSYKYTKSYIFSVILSSILHFAVNYYLFSMIW